MPHILVRFLPKRHPLSISVSSCSYMYSLQTEEYVQCVFTHHKQMKNIDGFKCQQLSFWLAVELSGGLGQITVMVLLDEKDEGDEDSGSLLGRLSWLWRTLQVRLSRGLSLPLTSPPSTSLWSSRKVSDSMMRFRDWSMCVIYEIFNTCW